MLDVIREECDFGVLIGHPPNIPDDPLLCRKAAITWWTDLALTYILLQRVLIIKGFGFSSCWFGMYGRHVIILQFKRKSEFLRRRSVIRC
jgi:hypothetical protein